MQLVIEKQSRNYDFFSRLTDMAWFELDGFYQGEILFK
jgi:hypothetical protein